MRTSPDARDPRGPCQQAAGRGLDADAVRAVIGFAVGDTRPDLTLLIRVPRAEALRRLAGRNAAMPSADDRFEAEHEAFFARVDTAYAALAESEPERVRVVDGTGQPDAIAARVREWVAPLLAA